MRKKERSSDGTLHGWRHTVGKETCWEIESKGPGPTIPEDPPALLLKASNGQDKKCRKEEMVRVV